MINLRVEPAAGVADIDLSRLRGLRWRGGARQARDVGLFEPCEGGQVQRLKFRRRLGVGVAVAPLVVALEGGADLLARSSIRTPAL